MGSQTRYCNLNATESWLTSAASMVDGNSGTFASTSINGDDEFVFFQTTEVFSIPTGATIVGISVRVTHYEGATGDRVTARLLVGGSAVGNTKTCAYSNTTTTETLGGPADMWGATITPSDVNNDGSDGFGLNIEYTQSTGKYVGAYCSYVEVTVYFKVMPIAFTGDRLFVCENIGSRVQIIDTGSPSGSMTARDYFGNSDIAIATGVDCITDQPNDICSDGTYLYVVTIGDDRVQKRSLTPPYLVSAYIGSNGSGDDQFANPCGICTDGTYIYIADSDNNRIVKRNCSNLAYVAKLGTAGTGDSQFSDVKGICTDGTYLYIADTGNDRIKKHLCSDLSYVSKIGTVGTGDDQFDSPAAIDIDADGTYIYVADTSNIRIQKRLASDLSYVAKATVGVTSEYTYGIACDERGRVYNSLSDLIETYNPQEVHKRLQSDLSYIGEIGTTGTAIGYFKYPFGLHVEKRSEVTKALSQNLTVADATVEVTGGTSVKTIECAEDITFADRLSKKRLSKKIRQTATFRTRPYPNKRIAYFDMETLRISKVKNLDDETVLSDMTITGATSDATGGPYGDGCYVFNGSTDDAVFTPDTGGVPIRTFVWWMKVTSNPLVTYSTPVVWNSQSLDGGYFWLYNTGTTGRLTVQVGGGGAYKSGYWEGSITLNEWSFYALVMDDVAGTATLYRDGYTLGTKSITGFVPGYSGDLYVGNYRTLTTHGLPGSISEVHAYTKCLTAAEVARLYLGKVKELTYDEAITLADRIRKTPGIKFQDQVTLTSVIARKFLKKKVRETSTVAHSTLSFAGSYWRRKFPQALTVSDRLEKSLLRKMSQSLTLTDNLVKHVKHLAVDTLDLADSVVKSIYKPVLQTLTVSDVLGTLRQGFARVVAETLTLLDSIPHRTFSKRVRETLSLRTRPYPNGRIASYDMETLRNSKLKNLDEESTAWDATIYGATFDATGGPYGDGCYDFVDDAFPNGDYMRILKNFEFGQGYGDGSVTVVLWAKTDALPAGEYSGLFVTDTGSPNTIGIRSRIESDYKLYTFFGSTLLGFQAYPTAANRVVPEEWHHIAISVNATANKVRYWVDAILIGNSDYFGGAVVAPVNNSACIGAEWNATGSYMRGSIADFQIYNKGLSSAEVLRLYLGKVKAKSLGQALTIIDQIRKTEDIRFVEQATLTVGVVRKYLTKRLLDSFTVADGLVRRFHKVIVQTATLTSDTLATKTGEAVKRLVETLTFAVDVSFRGSWVRSFSESLSPSDALVKSYRKSLYSAVTFSDRVTAGMQYLKSLVESIATSDVIVKHFGKVLGPYHFYVLWDALLGAWDMETLGTSTFRCTDAAANSTLHQIGCGGSDPVLVGDVSDGHYGKATDFDSNFNQRGVVTLSTTWPESVSTGAVLAWVRVTSAVTGVVMHRCNYATVHNHPWRLWLDAGVPKFTVLDKNDVTTSAIALSALSANTWHQLVATWDVTEGLIKISVDGGAFETAALADELKPKWSYSHVDVMGDYNYQTDCLTGQLDDCAIFSRPLTLGEARALYESRLGLNLSDLSASKAFWGPTFSDVVVKTFDKVTYSAITFSDALRRTFSKFARETLTFSDARRTAFGKRLDEPVSLVDSLVKRASMRLADALTVIDMLRKDVAHVLVETFGLTDTVETARTAVIAIDEALTVADTLVKSFSKRVYDTITTSDVIGQILKVLVLHEALTMLDTVMKRARKAIVEALTLVDVNIVEVTFTILTVTPLAGTFPRPARIATLSMKISTSDGALSGAVVTASIYTPSGVLWKTLTLAESAYTAGIYSANFAILGSDDVGSYPVSVVARYGSLGAGSYSGFITVFQGSLAAIHFR
jgi:DNA-binding beta-propeller fold protein YncE